MPIKNSELPTLFIMGPDGTKTILGKITQSEITPEDPYDFIEQEEREGDYIWEYLISNSK